MRDRIQHVIIYILCLLCCTAFFSMDLFGATAIDVNHSVSISIDYDSDSGAIPGAEFSVYKIGTIDTYGKTALTQLFSTYPISLSNTTAAEWQSLAITLSGYIQRDSITPVATGTTDVNGILKIQTSTASDFTPGVYIVLSKVITVNNYIYSAVPFIVVLPFESTTEREMQYDIQVKPKYQRAEITLESIKVLKVWNDAGYEEKRPSEVTVQLLRDEEVYDTVILKEANEWQYVWDGLSNGYEWNVVEETVSGYTVNITQSGTTYTIQNTYAPNAVPTPAPEPPIPVPPIPVQTIVIPQTGLLWWPVPILIILGIFFVLIGFVKGKREK
ncbi:MAG: Cna B-type domain-containing protein [Lachnospiraceae bacterium]